MPQTNDELHGSELPAEDDDPRAAGFCLTHGNYNGRLLRCPRCTKN